MEARTGHITVFPRHAHSMGYTVAARLKRGERVEYPDNPFNYHSDTDNHFAWANGYALACEDAKHEMTDDDQTESTATEELRPRRPANEPPNEDAGAYEEEEAV